MENEDDYLIRYKISMFMYDPRETILNSGACSKYEEPKSLRRDPFAKRDRESYLCDIVEGIASTLYPLNILLLQQGIDSLQLPLGSSHDRRCGCHKPF